MPGRVVEYQDPIVRAMRERGSGKVNSRAEITDLLRLARARIVPPFGERRSGELSGLHRDGVLARGQVDQRLVAAGTTHGRNPLKGLLTGRVDQQRFIGNSRQWNGSAYFISHSVQPAQYGGLMCLSASDNWGIACSRRRTPVSCRPS